ncbi:MAG: hypothetical protein APF76_12900 [Desulfitibacter sp. BRH_c19]|nr:MAG: hypothetical protein APF76_12900 [Desulfitibacter sp. BRH_c19]
MKDDTYIEEAIRLLRLQKHDVVNYLQIVLGYIQLNKGTEAQKHIKNAMNELNLKGSLLRIVHPRLLISLMSQIDKAFRLGIPLAIECKSNLKGIDIEEDLLIDLLEKTWDELLVAQLKQPVEERHIQFKVDTDCSFRYSGTGFFNYISKEELNELNSFSFKIGYEVVCSDENLIIRNIIDRG